MKKIEKVIEKCNDCQHCILLINQSTNHSSGAICANELLEKEFLLVYSDNEKNVVRAYNIEIPNNCPLETYKDEKS